VNGRYKSVEVKKMPKIVILGSCSFEPYEVLAVPNKLNPELYKKDHDKAYQDAFEKVFKKAIDQADVVIVYAPTGVGLHTQKDIDYAESKGKPVYRIPPTHRDDVFTELLKKCPKCGTELEPDLEDSSEWNCPRCNYGWRIY